MSDRRLQDLIRFYSILNELEKTIPAPAPWLIAAAARNGRRAASTSSVKPARAGPTRASVFVWCGLERMR
jgi:hypothetical protein